MYLGVTISCAENCECEEEEHRETSERATCPCTNEIIETRIYMILEM